MALVILACDNILFSSLFADRDVSRSSAAKSVVKRMFSQAMVIFASFISLQQNEVKLEIQEAVAAKIMISLNYLSYFRIWYTKLAPSFPTANPV